MDATAANNDREDIVPASSCLRHLFGSEYLPHNCMKVHLSLLMLKMAEVRGSSHSRSDFLILVVDPNIDRMPLHKALPLRRNCCFSAGPVAFMICLVVTAKSAEVCNGNSKQSNGEVPVGARKQ